MANEALKRACEIAGGQKPLADRIGTSQSQVWYWLEKSKKGVPAEFCGPIESATGVTRHELRPDIYTVPLSSSESSASPEPAPADPTRPFPETTSPKEAA